MIERPLPHLRVQENAAIISISSALAFVPFLAFPIYCAAKAGLHSFTQSLRVQLAGTNTPLFAPDFHLTGLPVVRAMDVKAMVRHAMDGLRKDRLEIRPGASNLRWCWIDRLGRHGLSGRGLSARRREAR